MLTKFGWIARPCPDSTETSCGENFLYRSCLYRSQGFYLRPEDTGVQNKLLFRLISAFSFLALFFSRPHPTGTTKQINLHYRVISCGKCVPVELSGCAGNAAVTGDGANHCQRKSSNLNFHAGGIAVARSYAFEIDYAT